MNNKIRAVLLSALFFISPPALSSPYSFEQDKQLHFGISIALGASFSYMGMTPLKACAYSSLIGVAKEIKDEADYGGFSHEDLLYDIAGSCLGSYVMDYASRQVNK